MKRNVDAHTLRSEEEEQWNLQGIVDYVECELSSRRRSLLLDDLRGKDPEEIVELIFAKVKDRYDEKEEQLGRRTNARV